MCLEVKSIVLICIRNIIVMVEALVAGQLIEAYVITTIT